MVVVVVMMVMVMVVKKAAVGGVSRSPNSFGGGVGKKTLKCFLGKRD